MGCKIELNGAVRGPNLETVPQLYEFRIKIKMGCQASKPAERERDPAPRLRGEMGTVNVIRAPRGGGAYPVRARPVAQPAQPGKLLRVP